MRGRVSSLVTGHRRATALACAGAIVGGVLLARGDGRPADPSSADIPSTVRVVRTTLTARQQVAGTLGYGEADAMTSMSAGVLTWRPAQGAVVRRGEALWSVDGHAVRLLYGAQPMYRTITWGIRGRDVRQLEANLRALGEDPDRDMTIDGRFDEGTYDAIVRFQRRHGLEVSGQLTADAVHFAPSAVRVAATHAALGATLAPGTPILSVTGARQVVTVDLPAAKQTFVRRGARTGVTLPDGRRVSGHITHIGRVARQSKGKTTVPVTIAVPASARRRYDEAPVQVALTVRQARGVLAVPVSALLALPGGRYAVETPVRGRLTRLTVAPGQYADGMVAISGRGIREGLVVVGVSS